MGHALAAIEPAILLGPPVALIAPYLKVRFSPPRQKDPPRGFKVGARLIEGRCDAA
jgi:hypothetical protein